MSKTTPAQIDVVERVLAHENASAEGAEERAAAVGRVYKQLSFWLAPLIGAMGVRALFARSAKLNKVEFPCLEEIQVAAESSRNDVETMQRLVACLSKLAPAAASQAATALYATFLRLMTDFVGERLVWQVLRRAYPVIDQSLPEERE